MKEKKKNVAYDLDSIIALRFGQVGMEKKKDIEIKKNKKNKQFFEFALTDALGWLVSYYG